MTIEQILLEVLIFITFVVSLLPQFRVVVFLCIPFLLSGCAIWLGFFQGYDAIFFIIPSFVAFITLIVMIHKAIEGDLI